MPIQRKDLPGNRNTATSIQNNNKRGWFTSLSSQDQELLNDPFLSSTVARENITKDDENGLTREEIIQFDNEIIPIDITNCDMIRNQNNDILSFMNCIYNTPSRNSFTPISHQNVVAGFNNFETEVNENNNNNTNTRNKNTTNSVVRSTNQHVNLSETVSNRHSLTVASSYPNTTSTKRATSWK